MNGRTARDLKANAVFGVVAMISNILFARLIVLGKAGHMGGDQYPIPNGEGTYLKGRKEIWKVARSH